MHIEWNKVTWYSKVIAVVLYVGTFALAFYLGYAYARVQPTVAPVQTTISAP